MTLPTARAIASSAEGVRDALRLPHHARTLRRRRLLTLSGEAILVDLPRPMTLAEGDALVLDDGRLVRVEAEPEPLLEARGDLARLAWHVGNRHAPCEIGEGWLRVLADPVMARMLRGLGAEVREVTAPFHPEGGAYGEGTPMGHSHGTEGQGQDGMDDEGGGLGLGGLSHEPL